MNLESVAARVRVGETVTFIAVGQSMAPRVKSGTEVTVKPRSKPPEKGDVVLVRMSGRWMLHLVSAVNGNRVQISNNHGHVNGWTDANNVIGMLS